MIAAGGEARLLYLAWRYGGHDPYRLYNSLDEQYRPVEGGEALPPLEPWRVKMFVYGCAIYAQKDEIQKAGGKTTPEQRAVPERSGMPR